MMFAEALNSASMCYGERVSQRACSLKYSFVVTQQAIGLQNIIGCFQCFRKKIRDSLYYLPLVCGSEGQDSFYSFNSCSKKLIRMVNPCPSAICGRIKNHPHGKIRVYPCSSVCPQNIIIRKPINLQIGILSFRFAKQIRMSSSS